MPFVRRHARKDLTIFSSKGVLCPCQCKASIVSNTARWAGVSFLHPLVGHTLFLWAWGDLLNWGCWGSSPRHIRDGGLGVEAVGVIETPFSTTCTTLFPRWEMGSFFLALILTYISWLNLVVISTEEKKRSTWKKEKKKREKGRTTRYDNTHSSLQLL